MTDGDALLKAILAHPDEDTPRLLYADWLQEQGDEDRAEFIRVQVESARGRHCRAAPTPCERCAECLRPCQLVTRERELWDQGVWKVYAAELPLLSFDGRPFLEDTARGFIDRVHCTAADWLEHSDRILAAHPVRRVRVAVSAVPDIYIDRRTFSVGNSGHAPFRTKCSATLAGRLVTATVAPGESGLIALLTARWPRIEFERSSDQVRELFTTSIWLEHSDRILAAHPVRRVRDPPRRPVPTPTGSSRRPADRCH